MEKEKLIFVMVIIMMVFLKMVKDQGMGFTFGQMEIDMKDNGKIMNVMAMDYFIQKIF
jgi:hypothetical protein